MELHERIYQLRKQKNMTQQDLADQLGVSRQAVSRWEMGTAKPELESLIVMSRIFGITVDELLTGEYSTPEEAPAASEKPKPNLRKWVIAWAVTYLLIVVIFAARIFVKWKFGGVLVAVTPFTLIVQLINLAVQLGIAFVVIYFICKLWKK